MHADRRFVLGVLVVVAVAGCVLGFSRDVRAQATTVDFVVPDGTALTTGDTGDILVFIGKAASTENIGNCASTGTYPVQTAVVIDPGAGQRATRIAGIIPTQVSDIPNGTKLGALASTGTCAIDGVIYVKFRGTVQ